jgi:hypothetical protein
MTTETSLLHSINLNLSEINLPEQNDRLTKPIINTNLPVSKDYHKNSKY